MKNFFIVLIFLLFNIGRLTSSNSIVKIEFYPEFLGENETIQKCLLFENGPKIRLVKSTPQYAMTIFSLDIQETNTVYLELNAKFNFTHRNYLLELRDEENNLIYANVTVYFKQKPVQDLIHFNIEYMFKFESKFGLIKDDMSANGVVSIVKLTTDLTNIELNLTGIRLENKNTFISSNSLFHVKKFLPKFYMIRLSQSVNEFDLSFFNEMIIIELSCFDVNAQSLIGKIDLKFRLVTREALQIKLNEKTFEDLFIYEKNNIPNYFLHKFEYSNEANNDFRFRIDNTNCPKCFQLNELTGHLHANILDREYFNVSGLVKLWLNVSVIDTRKLYRGTYRIFHLNILDLNDNAPKFKRDRYYISVDQANALNEAYSLIFNENAIDMDAGENGTLTYELISGNEFGLFYVEINNGKIWMSKKIFSKNDFISFYTIKLMCKDNGTPIFRHTIVDIVIKVKRDQAANMIGDKIFYYFEFELERLRTLGKLNLGKIAELAFFRLYDSEIFNEENFDFDVEINGNLIAYAKPQMHENQGYIEKHLDLTANKSLIIYVNPLTSSSRNTANKLVVFKLHEDYESNNFYYSIRQETRNFKRLIGTITTTCSSEEGINDFNFVNLDDHRFKLELNSNETSHFKKLDLFSVESLDYEFKGVYEFRIVAKCNNANFLWSKLIRVELIDLNDNQPKFLNPLSNLQVIDVNLNLINNSNGLYLLSRLQASDADKSLEYSAIKYLLGSVEFVENTCVSSNQYLKLDQTSGDLYLSEMIMESHKCEIYIYLSVTAYNYLDANSLDHYWSSRNEIKFYVRIKINPEITKKDQLNMQEFNIRIEPIGTKRINLIAQPIKLDDNSSVIEKCWLNEYLIEDQTDFYFSLQENIFYFYEKNEQDSLFLANKSNFVVECHISNQNGHVSWIKLNIQRNKNQFSNEIQFESPVHVRVNRKNLLQSEMFITKLSQINEYDFFTYQLSQSENSELAKELFYLNSLNGILTSKSIDNYNKRIVNSINMIKLSIQVLSSNTSSNLIVFLHLINEQPPQVKSNKIYSSIENQIFESTIDMVKSPQTVLDLDSLAIVKNQLSFQLIEYKEINLNSADPGTKPQPYIFSIINSTKLCFNHLSNNFTSRLYLIKVKLCENLKSESQIYSSQCKNVKFNLKINFNLTLVWTKFTKNNYKFVIISFENSFYMIENDQKSIKSINEIHPIIDLKTLVQNYTSSAKFETKSYSNLTFYLNKINGHIYVLDLCEVVPTRIEVFLMQSKAELQIDVLHLPSHLNINLTIKKDMGPFVHIYEALFSHINDLKCLNMQKAVCNNLFVIDNKNLLLNVSLAYSYFYEYNLFMKNAFEIQLIVSLDSTISLNINVSLNFEAKSLIKKNSFVSVVNPFREDDLIENINITTYGKLSRVVNLITNQEFTNLDFKITNHSTANFMQFVFDALDLKTSQLYMFEFDKTTECLYFIRFDCELQHMQKFIQFETLKMIDLNLNEAFPRGKNIFLIDQLFSNTKHSELDLKSFFKLNITTGQLKYTTPSFVDFEFDKNIFGSELTMIAYKFLIDSTTLKIFKIVKLEVKIEVTNRQSLVFEHKNLRFTKSELLEKSLDSDDESLSIYQLDHSDLIEYQLIYDQNTDLPFSIDRFTGLLSFHPIIIKKFKYDHEITFKFIVIGRDVYSSVKNVSFEILIQNDEPLVVFDRLRREFFVDENFGSNQLIGSIGIPVNVENKKVNLKFEMSSSQYFRIDRHTGLLFSKSQINSKLNKLFKLDIKVTGKIGHRNVLFLIDALVIVKETSKIINTPIKSERHEKIFFSNDSTEQKFELNLNNYKKNLRYRIIDDSKYCEANWFTSTLLCNTKKFEKNLNNLTVIAYDLDSLEITDLVKITIYSIQNKKIQSIDLNKQGKILSLKKQLQISWSSQGQESIGYIYEMIYDEYGIDIDPDQYRIFLLTFNRSLNFDSISSELKLVNLLKHGLNTFYLKFKLVDSFQSEFQIFLQLEINFTQIYMPSYLLPYFPVENFTFSIEFNTIKTWLNQNSLLKIGKIEAYLYKPEQLLENPNLFSEQKQYLTYFIEENSPVFINKNTGVIWVNVSKLITLNEIVVAFNILASNQGLVTKTKSQINISNANKFDLIALKLGYFDTNPIQLEKHLDQSKLKRNDEIFNLNQIIFNSNQNLFDLDYELKLLKNESFPFKIDPYTSQLILTDELEFVSKVVRTHLFQIQLTKNLKINVKLMINSNINALDTTHTNGLSEVLNFRISRTCTNSHFIGSLNNFFSLDENTDKSLFTTEYRFVLSDSDLNEILYLNETTGDFYCNKNTKLTNKKTVKFDVEVYAKIRNFKQFFFYKSLILNLEIYESNANYYNEHLVYEMKLKENTLVESDVWSMPFSVNLRYDHCSIISGNIYNTFYLNTANLGALLLVRPLDYTLKSSYNLKLRCMNTNELKLSTDSSELDIELNIEVLKENFFSYIQHRDFLAFDSDIYEINITDSIDRIPVKLNAFYPKSTNYLNNEKIIYRYLNDDEDETNQSLKKFFLLNELTGEIYIKNDQFLGQLKVWCQTLGNKTMNILRTVKAFNRIDESHYTTTLLKIILNCDKHNFNQIPQFHKTNYFTSIKENSAKGTRLNIQFSISNMEHNQLIKPNFYFCKKMPNNTFVIDKTTGYIFLNQETLDREYQSLYTYDICSLVYDSSNKSQILSTKLTIKIEDVNDNSPKILTFDSKNKIELNLPYKFLSQQFCSILKPMKLFQLSAIDYDTGLNGKIYFKSQTLSSHVLSINTSTGWVYIRQMPNLNNRIHQLKIKANDLGTPESRQSTELNLLINFVDDSQTTTIYEINVPAFNLKPNTKIFNLQKDFLKDDMFKYLVLKNNENFIYDQTNGDLILVKLNKSMPNTEIEIKLISSDSDLKIAIVKVNFYNQQGEIIRFPILENKPKLEKFSILLSTRTAFDTVIFMLDQTKLELIDNNGIFQIDDTDEASKLIVKKNLTLLAPNIESITLNLRIKSVSNFNAQLKIYILENLLNNFNFSQLIYYTERSSFSSNKVLAQLETSLSNPNFVDMFDEDNLIKINSFNFTEIKCDTSIVQLKKNPFNIRLIDQNKIQIEILNLTNYMSSFGNCKTFEFKISLNFSTNLLLDQSNQISTNLFIRQIDLLKFNFLKALDSLSPTYNTHLNISAGNNKLSSYSSISLYDLINFNPYASSFNKLIQFKAFYASPDNSMEILDYRLNTINGIFLININKTSQTLMFKAKFEIICYFFDDTSAEFVYLRNIYLNIFVSKANLMPPVYFTHDYIQTNYVYSQDSNTKIIDMKHFSINYSAKSTYTLSKFVDFIHMRSNGQLHLRTNTHIIDTIQLVNISVCTGNMCDQCTVLIDIKSIANFKAKAKIETFELTNIGLKFLNSIEESGINIFKLKHRFNYDEFKTVVNQLPENNLKVSLNTLNGCLYFKKIRANESINLINSRNISVFYMPTNQLQYQVNIKTKNDFEIESRNNLLVEFYLNTVNMDNNIGIYITNVGPSKSNLVGCEIWHLYDDDSELFTYRLEENCDLFLMLKRSFKSFKLIQNKFQLRTYAKYEWPRVYKFYDVQINLKELPMSTFQVEFRSLNKDISLINLYNYLMSNLSLNLVGYKNSKNENETNMIILGSTDLKNLTVEILQFKLRSIENDFKIAIQSVKNQIGDKNSNFISNTNEIINAKNFILSSMYREMSQNKIGNELKFEKLNYFKYENLNLSNNQYLNIKFLFKSTSTQQQLLFYANIGYFYLCSNINSDLKFEVRHNLTSGQNIHFDDKLEINVWYEVEIQFKHESFDISLRKWSFFNNIQVNSSSLKLNTIPTSKSSLKVEYLFIGGLNRHFVNLVSSQEVFYSDNLYMADFKLNNQNLFDNKPVEYLMPESETDELNDSSKLNILSSNDHSMFKLQFNMRKHYKKFIQINNFSKNVFNLTFVFDMNLTSGLKSEINLFHTKQTLIRLNLIKSQFEYLLDDEIVGFIQIDQNLFNQSFNNSFSLIIDNQSLNLKLNEQKNNFKLTNEDKFEFFQSESIELDSLKIHDEQNYFCFNEIYLNKHRLGLSTLNLISKEYQTELIMLNNAKISKINCSTKSTKPVIINTKLKNYFLNENIFSTLNYPTSILIIITVGIMFGFMVIALVSILVNIYLRRKRISTNSSTTQINQTQNSPSSSLSASSLSTLTNVHNCNHLLVNKRSTMNASLNESAFQQENYLEYDGRLSKNQLCEEFKSTNQILVNEEVANQKILTIVSRKLSSIFRKKSSNINGSNSNSNSNLILPFNNNQQLKSNEKSENLFNVNDLYNLKDNLNWMPSFELYRNVFNELENFPSNSTNTTSSATSFNQGNTNEFKNEEITNVLVLENVSTPNTFKQHGQQTFV